MDAQLTHWRCNAVLDETEESGWKNIHGEVFRFPPNKNLFCAFVGSGFQVSSQTYSALLRSSCSVRIEGDWHS